VARVYTHTHFFFFYAACPPTCPVYAATTLQLRTPPGTPCPGLPCAGRTWAETPYRCYWRVGTVVVERWTVAFLSALHTPPPPSVPSPTTAYYLLPQRARGRTRPSAIYRVTAFGHTFPHLLPYGLAYPLGNVSSAYGRRATAERRLRTTYPSFSTAGRASSTPQNCGKAG